MKSLFPGFYPPSTKEFTELWKNSVFVLDANVLLNLYRYPIEAKDDLMRVFSELAKRIWVPYHAALEYQRNRITVIAEQKKRFVEVQNLVGGIVPKLEGEFGRLQIHDRHAVIDPSDFIEKLKPVIETFKTELTELEKKQSNIHDEDLLRKEIDKLLAEKVGEPPTQVEIDQVSKDGETRFQNNMPPGFSDEKKGEGLDASFSYGGVTYPRKFGDLIIWRQIIKHAKNKKLKSIIFITDDEKPDWWWKYDSQGERILGPRPELVEEICRLAEIEKFYMYNTESFLKYSQEFLTSKVKPESIEQVREVRNVRAHSSYDFMHWVQMAETCVFNWVAEKYPLNIIRRERWPDIVVDLENGERIGVEVVPGTRISTVRIRERAYHAYHDIHEGKYSSIELVVVLRDGEEEALRQLHRFFMELPSQVRISFGRLVPDSDTKTGMKYLPLGELGSNYQPRPNK